MSEGERGVDAVVARAMADLDKQITGWRAFWGENIRAAARPAPGGDDELRRAVREYAIWYRPICPTGVDSSSRMGAIFRAAGLMRLDPSDFSRLLWFDPAPPEPDDDGLEAAVEAFRAANGEWERDRSEASQARLIAAIERFGAAARARRRKDTPNNGG